MAHKSQYPAVIENIDRIICRLLNEDITMTDIATDYKATHSAIQWQVKKKATALQYEAIVKKSNKIAGLKRCGRVNNPGGCRTNETKIKAFTEMYADPNSLVKHRIVRPSFEVQSKDANGDWVTIDHPTCEDAAVLLLAALIGYDLISHENFNENSPCHD